MSNPIPGQANVRTAVLRDHSNDPITTGTVHYYLMALTGTNAGLHYVKTSGWTFNEVYYDAVTEPDPGQVWSIEVEEAAWDNGVQYAEYFVDAAGRNTPEHVEFICGGDLSGLVSDSAFTTAALINAPTGATATFSIAQPAAIGAFPGQVVVAYRYCGFSWSIPFTATQAGGTLKFCTTSLSDATTILWSLDSTHFTIAGDGLSAVVADTDAYTTNAGEYAWFIHNLTTDRRAAEGTLTIRDGPNVTA